MQLGKAKKHANFYSVIEKLYTAARTHRNITDIEFAVCSKYCNIEICPHARGCLAFCVFAKLQYCNISIFPQRCASSSHKHPTSLDILWHFYGGLTFINSD